MTHKQNKRMPGTLVSAQFFLHRFFFTVFFTVFFSTVFFFTVFFSPFFFSPFFFHRFFSPFFFHRFFFHRFFFTVFFFTVFFHRFFFFANGHRHIHILAEMLTVKRSKKNSTASRAGKGTPTPPSYDACSGSPVQRGPPTEVAGKSNVRPSSLRTAWCAK